MMTGEQPHRATGIAVVCGCGAGAGAAAAVLSSASRCRDGSRTTARITPSPSSDAEIVKARV